MVIVSTYIFHVYGHIKYSTLNITSCMEMELKSSTELHNPSLLDEAHVGNLESSLVIFRLPLLSTFC